MNNSPSREPVGFFVFSASLREGSLNTRLTALAAEVIGANGGKSDFVSMTEFDRPSYNADVEATEGMPAGAHELRRRLELCDGS
jgi:chromate reductase, NAD(P)H dehydrogenase (quinone)